MTASVLQNMTPEDVRFEPFPHVVIPNALVDDYYQSLADSFPDTAGIKNALKAACKSEADTKSLKRSLRHLKRSNRRVNLPSKHVVQNGDCSAVWREFIDFHSSEVFVRQLLLVFAGAIDRFYPGLSCDNLSIARRGSTLHADLWVDALKAVNTPFKRRGEITGPQTDHPNKLFIGLYYFKIPEDTAGGDLMLYKRLTPVTKDNLKWPKPDTVSQTSTVPYDANTLVILLNTPQAVHGVTPRLKTPYNRRFVNFIVESHRLSEFAAF